MFLQLVLKHARTRVQLCRLTGLDECAAQLATLQQTYRHVVALICSLVFAFVHLLSSLRGINSGSRSIVSDPIATSALSILY